MKQYLIAILLFLTTMQMSCETDSIYKSENNDSGNTGVVGEEVLELEDSDYVENATFTTTISINYEGESASVTGQVDGVSISQQGGNIIVTSTIKEVEYILSGNTGNGSFKIYSDYKFKLTFDGVAITNPTGPAINIQSGKTSYIVSPENTVNILTGGIPYTSYGEEDMKACLFSEGQIILSGSGQLTINANYKHAICSDDYIVVRENSDIVIPKTASDGIHANDYIIIAGGTIRITAVGEGLDCEYGNIAVHDGNLIITTNGEKGHCLKSEGNTTINGGSLSLTTTGYSSRGIKSKSNLTINDGEIEVKTTGRGASEGIESKNILTINSGKVMIESYDDCINATNAIIINGGTIYCYSSSNDGIDSNGTLTITDGVIISSGTSAPQEGFDCDQNTFKITGGILVGTGGSTSTPTSNVCTQNSVIYGGTGTSGQFIHIRDSEGNAVLTYRIPRSYSQMTLLYSSPQLLSGKTYTILSGGSVSDGTEMYGYYVDGVYTGGTQLTTFTASSVVKQVGNISGIGGGGNQPGGGGRPGGGDIVSD